MKSVDRGPDPDQIPTFEEVQTEISHELTLAIQDVRFSANFLLSAAARLETMRDAVKKLVLVYEVNDGDLNL